MKHIDKEINGRTFRIKKFDARTGAPMLFKMGGLVAPLVKGINLDFDKLSEIKGVEEALAALKDIDISGILTGLASIPETDFAFVQDKCLRVCSEVLPGGLAPVLDERGNFGVLELEDDTMAVLALTAHALIFNFKGFFSGSPLASLIGTLSITSP